MSTTAPASPTPSTRADQRRRRRVVAVGVLGLVGLGGAFEGIPRIEDDLERRVAAELAESGVTGVSASFSGQDGTLRCETALDDPANVVAIAEDVWGVRVAELDGSCGRGSAAPDAAAGSTDSTDAVDATDASDSTVPGTTEDSSSSPATDTTDATPSTEVTTTEVPTTDAGDVAALGTGPDVTVQLANGVIVLEGTVPDDATRSRLVDAAATVVAVENIDDRLVVDPGASGEAKAVDASIGGLAGLVEVMPVNLVSGTARLVEGAITLEGVYLDDPARAAIEEVAGATGAEVTLEPRADATATDAAALADELNDLVAADPILFEPGSATLTAAADAVVDRVAATANRFEGVAIDVVGHTDSDGDAARNLDLSQRRAATVVAALGERGVTASLTAVGRGETEPVVVGGVEDKTASRRVVFAVVNE